MGAEALETNAPAVIIIIAGQLVRGGGYLKLRYFQRACDRAQLHRFTRYKQNGLDNLCKLCHA